MLDWDLASYQRSVIRDSVKLLHRAGVRNLPILPKCKSGNPCGDGRCPQCGSDLLGLFLDYDRSASARSQRWQRTALACDLTRYAVAGEPSDILAQMKEAAIDAIDHLLKLDVPESEAKFAFIGMVGIRYSRQSAVKCAKQAIFECTVTGRENALTVVLDRFQKVFGNTVSYLPPDSEPSLGTFKTLQLVENLLLPYDEYRGGRFGDDNQIGESALIEMANNYGPHRIETRLVTYGLDYKEREITFAQRPWVPAQYEVPIFNAN